MSLKHHHFLKQLQAGSEHPKTLWIELLDIKNPDSSAYWTFLCAMYMSPTSPVFHSVESVRLPLSARYIYSLIKAQL